MRPKKLLAEGGFAFVYLVRACIPLSLAEPVCLLRMSPRRDPNEHGCRSIDVSTGDWFRHAQATDDPSGQDFVLKRMIIGTNPQAERVARGEMRLMERLQHRNIVRFVSSAVVEGRGGREAYVVMEFCARGHLFSLMRDMQEAGQRFREPQVLQIFGQICAGVGCLHSQNPPIAHRDIKLENVLLSQDNTCKLCDFGSCALGPQSIRTASERSTQEEDIEKNTTPNYRAPEMCDLYSVASGMLTEVGREGGEGPRCPWLTLTLTCCRPWTCGPWGACSTSCSS